MFYKNRIEQLERDLNYERSYRKDMQEQIWKLNEVFTHIIVEVPAVPARYELRKTK